MFQLLTNLRARSELKTDGFLKDKGDLERLVSKWTPEKVQSLLKPDYSSFDPTDLANLLTDLENWRRIVSKYTNCIKARKGKNNSLDKMVFNLDIDWLRLTNFKVASLSKRVEKEIEAIPNYLNEEYAKFADLCNYGKMKPLVRAYSGLRKAISIALSPRIEGYIQFSTEMPDIQSAVEELKSAKKVFPNSKKNADIALIEAERVLGKVKELSCYGKYPESNCDFVLAQADELMKHFVTISRGYNSLRTYRNGLVSAAKEASSAIEKITSTRNIETALKFIKALNLPNFAPPFETNFFQNEERDYSSILNTLSIVIDEKKKGSRNFALKGIEEIRSENSSDDNPAKAKRIIEDKKNRLREYNSILIMLGEDLGFANRLEDMLNEELASVNELLKSKGKTEQEYSLIKALGNGLHRLIADINRYGINNERISRLIDIENQAAKIEGGRVSSKKGIPLDGVEATLNYILLELNNNIEGAKGLALARVDGLYSEFAGKQDKKNLEAVKRLYEALPMNVFERISKLDLELNESLTKSVYESKPKYQYAPKDKSAQEVIFTNVEESLLSEPKPNSEIEGLPSCHKIVIVTPSQKAKGKVGYPPVQITTYFLTLEPPNIKYYPIIDALRGDWDTKYLDRLNTFNKFIKKIAPGDSEYEIDFMAKVKHGISQMAECSIMRNELTIRPEGRQIINEAMMNVDSYADLMQ